ncbi:MAG TPA: cyclic nucleotide-binding domain-containing protein [Gammaproteobacteria bacterium]|nr:cyclic nucleotide-binding domain-containing protein [Gammaproteobacteria bacterium]
MATPNRNDRKISGKEILRDLIPLNALTDGRFQEIASSLSIMDVNAGSYLFGEGDTDNRSIYLLDGVVNFIDKSGKVTGVVSAGTDPARYPLANRQPRIITARAATKSVIASIDSTLLDVMLTLDQSTETGAIKLGTGNEEDWMSRMLQSDVFSRLPPSDIQRLIQALEPVTYNAGDKVIRQGDEGDYFYIIREGSCSVTRLASGKGWDVPLAELKAGDSFGEDALVSDARRNATVTMLSDGWLMRLSKHYFLDILKKQLVQYVNYEMALSATKSGDTWLDVRLPEEYENNALANSMNIPLASIRNSYARLEKSKKYIVYCDTGRRSAAAAFLLGKRGFDVSVLEGGLNHGVPDKVMDVAGKAAPAKPAAATVAPAAAAPAQHPAKSKPAEPVKPSAAQSAPKATAATPENSQLIEKLQRELGVLRSELDNYATKARQMETAYVAERKAREQLMSRVDNLLARLKPATGSKK